MAIANFSCIFKRKLSKRLLRDSINLSDELRWQRYLINPELVKQAYYIKFEIALPLQKFEAFDDLLAVQNCIPIRGPLNRSITIGLLPFVVSATSISSALCRPFGAPLQSIYRLSTVFDTTPESSAHRPRTASACGIGSLSPRESGSEPIKGTVSMRFRARSKAFSHTSKHCIFRPNPSECVKRAGDALAQRAAF